MLSLYSLQRMVSSCRIVIVPFVLQQHILNSWGQWLKEKFNKWEIPLNWADHSTADVATLKSALLIPGVQKVHTTQNTALDTTIMIHKRHTETYKEKHRQIKHTQTSKDTQTCTDIKTTYRHPQTELETHQDGLKLQTSHLPKQTRGVSELSMAQSYDWLNRQEEAKSPGLIVLLNPITTHSKTSNSFIVYHFKHINVINSLQF